MKIVIVWRAFIFTACIVYITLSQKSISATFYLIKCNCLADNILSNNNDDTYYRLREYVREHVKERLSR